MIVKKIKKLIILLVNLAYNEITFQESSGAQSERAYLVIEII